jgi:L-arabinokinase
MDQAASVLGDENQMLPLVCQPCRPQPLVRMPEGLQCWGIDSGVRHAVTGAEYEAARAAAFIGYGMICEWEHLRLDIDQSNRIPRYVDERWNGYLSNITPSLFRSKYEARLPETLSGSEFFALGSIHPDPFTSIKPETAYRVRACTRYAIEENHRIELFVELARGANHDVMPEVFRMMGDLMLQSHWSYTECGLGCPATDLLVDLVRQESGENGLYGAKITGGGAGGTVAVLGAKGADEAFQRVVQKYAQARSCVPYIFDGSSMGADRFGVRMLEAQS